MLHYWGRVEIHPAGETRFYPGACAIAGDGALVGEGITMGGKPNPGTKKDKRIGGNGGKKPGPKPKC